MSAPLALTVPGMSPVLPIKPHEIRAQKLPALHRPAQQSLPFDGRELERTTSSFVRGQKVSASVPNPESSTLLL